MAAVMSCENDLLSKTTLDVRHAFLFISLPSLHDYDVKIGQSHDFWRAYSLFVSLVASFAPEREAQMMLRGTQINYMTDKSHAIIIIINTQGQIVPCKLPPSLSAAASKMKTQRKPNKLN